MKKIPVLLLILMILGCSYTYQRNNSEYTEQEIIDRAKIYFGYDFDFQNKGNKYFVDKEELSVDSVKNLLTHCEGIDKNLNCGIILTIDTKQTKQIEKEKNKILEKTKSNLNKSISKVLIRPDICDKCKLVIIDYKPYHNREAQKILNKIRVQDIESIIEYEKPLNPNYFGTMSKAGWVQIWMK